MECKLSTTSIKFVTTLELIDTLWNVNGINFICPTVFSLELIDTLWNVNDDVFVFFVSWFNELIDTLWNVNKEYLQKIRYIAEN